MMKSLYALSLLLLAFGAAAQQKYQINGVPVIQNGSALQNPWVGGLNNPVISPIDFNHDGLMDLYMFDKAGSKSLSFVNTGSPGHPNFTYAPQYDRCFPPGMHDWALIRDYNHDGIADIFTLYENVGIGVYRGVMNGSQLSFEPVYRELLFKINAFAAQIWSFSDNLPVVMDIDSDGAIDILAPDQNAVNLDWYRNTAIDSGYGPDSLTFIDMTACWGQFIENGGDCNVTLEACRDALHDSVPANLRHQGGACFGTRYRRGGKLVSIFVSDVFCDNTKFLCNNGSVMHADMTWVDSLFPGYDVPVNMPLFPAMYGADIDNDGYEDLLAAPFASNRYVASQSQDRNVIMYYRNNGGTDSINTYHYEGDTLINNSLVDFGSESQPVFFDYNGDGLMDIVAGGWGHFGGVGLSGGSGLPGITVSSLSLFKNTGTANAPVFELIDTDWCHLSQYNILALYPAFGDMDGDGLPDMVVGDSSGYINFFKNRGTDTLAAYPALDSANWCRLYVGCDAVPFIYDVNGDSLPDLVIGSSGRITSQTGGNIFYYWNFGSRTHPRFSADSVNQSFGNMRVWNPQIYNNGFAAPLLRSENGQTMIYSGSISGAVYKYALDPDSLRSGSFALLDSDVLGWNPGYHSKISIADINNDGKADYLVGNIRGGMTLYSDTAWSGSSTNAIKPVAYVPDELQAYPNPAGGKLWCRLQNSNARLISACLLDLQGETMQVAPETVGENTLALAVSNLANGIYILRARDDGGRTYQQKVSIYK